MKNRLVAYLILFTALFTLIPVHASGEEPTVSARSSVLYEPTSGVFLVDRDGNRPMPMASTTKIATALVVLNHTKTDDVVMVPPEACGIEGSSLYLKPGEALTVLHLLYGLLLQSANDAAVALAIHTCGSVPAFCDEMNHTAQQLGAHSTHFSNPHGLDAPDHYTTAHDLALISAAAMENPLFAEIVATKKYSIPGSDPNQTRILFNHNKLLRLSDEAIGVKTGFTRKSGRCLVGAAEQEGITLISVTLQAPDDWNDHLRLFRYGFSLLENRQLCGHGEFRFLLPLLDRPDTSVAVTNSENVRAVLLKNAAPPTVRIDLPHTLSSHHRKGECVGYLSFWANGRQVAESPLVITS